MRSTEKTKQLTIIAMLCALSYISTVVFTAFPPILSAAPFLKYDPKDIIITIGGLLFGPTAALIISVIVPVIEFFTISTTGPIGLLMNVLSSAVFSGVTAYVYRKKHTIQGALIGLVIAFGLTVGVMLLWNYFVTPLYMDASREMVVGMLVPVILPFNVIKYGLNSALTLLLYKPIATALRKAKLISTSPNAQKAKLNVGVILVALLIIASCILLALVLNGTI